MTDFPYFNDDPRYELMAEIIDSANGLPDDETVKADFIEILRLCYTYTLDHRSDTSDLAGAIVTYLKSQWTSMYFEPYASEYWTPSDTPSETPSDTGSDTGSDDEVKELRRPIDVTARLVGLDD